MGKLYFKWRRRLNDLTGRVRFASAPASGEYLPCRIFSHSTPLFRKLRNAEMWMQRNKVINLGIAVKCINGIILGPGESFSFWRAVGSPSARKGYRRAMVLHNGVIGAANGGGLCQLSNLIYWMTLHTPLTVTERWRHTHDVFPDSGRTQPFGSGATVAYNYIDLRIRNDTDVNFQLTVWVGESRLHGEWRSSRPCPFSYRIYESGHRITQQPWGGYTRHNVIRRSVYGKEGLISDSPVAENNAVMMYQPLLDGGRS